MFKDYDKYFTVSLKVYLFVLFCTFILKLVGLDYFGITSDFDLFPYKTLYAIYTYILLYFTTLILLSISCNDKSKKMKFYVLITYPFSFIISNLPRCIQSYPIYFIISFSYLYLLCLIFTKFKDIKGVSKRYVVFTILNIFYQFISLITRDARVDSFNNSFIVMFILNFDYILMLLISYNLYFKIGGKKLWNHYQVEEVGSSLQKKINLKTLLKNLQKNWHKFKKLDRETKLAGIIYFILSFIWNTFTLVVVLFIAKLNNTLIECIFIISSFWLSKKIFGKAFHLKSMIQCFVISNLTYYILNRITLNIGISILIQILLGVGLSYLTSKLVKKMYKPLYRGMPKELFEETILKVTDKGSLKYNICYDYFVNRKSSISLSIKYNYSKDGIDKIKDRINAKIKELN